MIIIKDEERYSAIRASKFVQEPRIRFSMKEFLCQATIWGYLSISTALLPPPSCLPFLFVSPKFIEFEFEFEFEFHISQLYYI